MTILSQPGYRTQSWTLIADAGHLAADALGLAMVAFTSNRERARGITSQVFRMTGTTQLEMEHKAHV